MRAPGMVISFHEEKIEKELADLARLNGLDAMIVVSAPHPQIRAGHGVGVVINSRATTVANAMVHAHLSVKIVGPNGKVLVRGGFGGLDAAKPVPAEYGLAYELKDNLRRTSSNACQTTSPNRSCVRSISVSISSASVPKKSDFGFRPRPRLFLAGGMMHE